MIVQPTDQRLRPKLWSKEQVLNDLATTSLSITDLCKKYAPSPEKWRGFYSDIWKWRRLDKNYNEAIIKVMAEKGKDLRNPKTGRKRLDKDDADWRERYCDELMRQRGNRVKAAAVTPYTFESISHMLSPIYTSYDEKLTKMVKTTELKIAAIFEEMLVSCADEANFDSLEAAKIAQAKAWISTKALEKYDEGRFGRTSRLNVSGTVRHELAPVKREQLIASLVDEQARFMQARGLALPAPKEPVEIVDAEYVKVENG